MLYSIIHKLFTCEAKSVDRFVEVLKKNGCRGPVTIQLLFEVIKDHSIYTFELSAKTSRGRKVTCKLLRLTTYIDSHKFANRLRKYYHKIILILNCNDRIIELQKQLPPGIEVIFVGIDGKLINKDTIFKCRKAIDERGKIVDIKTIFEQRNKAHTKIML